MSWLQNQVNQNPHKLFIQKGDRQYSFVDVGDMAATYSKALLKEGIKTQDRILIYLPSTVEFIEIILACFEIGAVAVPISQKFTDLELEQISSINFVTFHKNQTQKIMLSFLLF